MIIQRKKWIGESRAILPIFDYSYFAGYHYSENSCSPLRKSYLKSKCISTLFVQFLAAIWAIIRFWYLDGLFLCTAFIYWTKVKTLHFCFWSKWPKSIFHFNQAIKRFWYLDVCFCVLHLYTGQKWKRYTFAFGQNCRKAFSISISFL